MSLLRWPKSSGVKSGSSSLSINPLFNYRSDRLLFFFFLRWIFLSLFLPSPKTDGLHKFSLFLSRSVFILARETFVLSPQLFNVSSEVCFILVWVNYLSHDSCAHRLRGHYNKLPEMCAHSFLSLTVSIFIYSVCVLWVRCSFCRGDSRTPRHIAKLELYGKNTARTRHKEKGKSLKVRFSHRAHSLTEEMDPHIMPKVLLAKWNLLRDESKSSARFPLRHIFVRARNQIAIYHNAPWKIGSACANTKSFLGLVF